MTQDNRIPGKDTAVSLREVTFANLFEVLHLEVKSRPNATQMTTNHVTGDSNTGVFCKKLGFEHTGEEDRSELETGLVF